MLQAQAGVRARARGGSTHSARQLRSALGLLLTLALAAPVAAQAPGPQPPSAAIAPLADATAPPAERAAALARDQAGVLVRWLRDQFKLPPELVLDDSLRVDLDALTAPVPERLRPAFERWAREALAEQPEPDAAWTTVKARYHNALTSWRLHDGGPAHEAAMRAVALAPAVCRRLNDIAAGWAEVASMLQQMPPAQRAAALEGEARLLAAFTQAPVDYPLPTAVADPGADVRRAVEAARQGRPVVPAVPPALAARLFSDPPRDLTAPLRCARRQWWAAHRLAAPAGAAEAAPADAVWRTWRLLFARDALQGWLAEPYPNPEGAADYPALARRLFITGSVMVEVRFDKQGRFAEGRVTDRKLVMQGLPPGTPLPGLAHLLDGRSLARARQVLETGEAQPRAMGADGVPAPLVLEMVWKLD